MRFLALIAAAALSATPLVPAFAQQAEAEVVQRHIDAYRARDMSAFLNTFSADAVLVYGGMEFRGRAEIRQAYSLNFVPDAPRIEVRSSGAENGMIWMETAYRFANGEEICCGYSEYTVQAGKITMLVVSGP